MTTQSNHLHATEYCLRSNLLLITFVMCMLVVCSYTALHDNQPYALEGKGDWPDTIQTPSPADE